MTAILIAGTNSGSGKTTTTLGILKALCLRGLKVQPFKVGPDYIDTAWHSKVVGTPSHNLDEFMLPPDELRALYHQQTRDKDIAVIEGVMGFYDGFGTDPYYCSSAGMARTLGCPVILVLDGKAMSTSAAAIVKGFESFAPDVNIAGVIFNQVTTENHYQLLKNAVETYCNVRVVGRLPKLPEVELPSRHLGLVTVHESPDMTDMWNRLAAAVEEYIDMEALLEVATSAAPSMPSPENTQIQPPAVFNNIAGIGDGLTIAIARDQAFNFYYQSNLDLLAQSGARLCYFSPMHDTQLPECDMVYLGGGYPELYAETLAANVSMRESILRAHQANVAIYAECGGLMYLGSSLRDKEDKVHAMVGVLDGHSHMTARLQRFGYCCAEATMDTLLCKSGQELRGHEFHYSDFETQLPTAFVLSKRRDGEVLSEWHGGYQQGNTLAMYLHLHFAQSPDILRQWFARGRNQ